MNLPGNGTIALDFRRSDHAPFWDVDVAAIMLTDGANFRNHNYHEPSDTIGALSFTFMSNVVKGAVATLATLAGIQHSTYYDADIIPTSIPKTNVDCNLSLYPVPVGNLLTIENTGCIGNTYTVNITDLTGKTIITETISGKTKVTIATDKLPAGNYFTILRSANGTITKRFIK